MSTTTVHDAQHMRLAAGALAHTFSDAFVADRPVAIADLMAEMEQRYRLNTPEALERRAAKYPVPDAVVGDYRERLVDVGGERHALCGIRWLGGDRTRPFVDVWPDYAIETTDEVRHLAVVAEKEFGMFTPEAMRLYAHPEVRWLQELPAVGERRLRWIAGRIADIQRSNATMDLRAVHLELLNDTEYYDWYLEVYRDFHAATPILADRVPVTDMAEMKVGQEHGLLYLATIDGTRAGVMAARPVRLLGRNAVYITEEVLVEEFRGKGYAHILQRRFVDTLSGDYELVWGMIDALNTPSLGTARKVGRVVVREEVFVPLRGRRDL